MTGQGSELAPICVSEFGPKTPHGFFGRVGGLSTGLYKGLNCGLGSDDDKAVVRENRSRVAQGLALPPANLLTVYQIHSADVQVITQAHTYEDAPHADAMVTATPGLGLGILTADCAPVLFADAAAGVIGAAHAGWKGAKGGVLENTIAAMEKLGANPAAIIAAVGPTISQANYEVGPEFKETFLEDDVANDAFFDPSTRPDHFQFDLPGYACARLKDAGIHHVIDTALCTYADEARYYSYRRATHAQEADNGRNISVIVLAP